MKGRVAGLVLAALALAGCSSVEAAVTGAPGAGTVSCTDGTFPAVPGWSQAQLTEGEKNARAIIAVAVSLGLGQQGAVVGVTAALTESTLQNVNYGDYNSNGTMTTSRGLFQMMDAWGPLADRLDPTKAATIFYTVDKGPGVTGLTHIAGWQNMTVQMAAQSVEGSQFSDGSNYAAQVPLAQQIVSALFSGCHATITGGTAAIPGASALGGAIVAAAQTQLGVRYSWGGGSLTGPTVGQHDGGVADSFGDYAAVGWDCSALTRFAVYTATQGQVTIPRTAADQRGAGGPVAADLTQMQPGDLVVFGSEHVGIYVGGGRMIDAPESGQVVRYDSLTGGGVNGNPATWTVRRITTGTPATSV